MVLYNNTSQTANEPPAAMGSKKKYTRESKKARRSELVDQVKHPYITGQGLDRRRRAEERRDRDAPPDRN